MFAHLFSMKADAESAFELLAHETSYLRIIRV